MKSYLTKALFLTSFISLLSFNSVSASTDIEGTYAKEAILELVEKGIITGDANGNFNPTSRISRQDFASILAKSLELDTSSSPVNATFTDVPVNLYSYANVEEAVKAVLISGNVEEKFGTNTNLTREDMATLFVQALGAETNGYGEKLSFAHNDYNSEWSQDAVAAAVELGLMIDKSTNSFDPQLVAEREQVAQIANKYFVKK